MTPPSPAENLNQIHELLKQLGRQIIDIYRSAPDIFDDQNIGTELEQFLNAYRDANNRLEYPRLRIATIGTTSSGKSTIVNSLIGRRIAPIEAGEMSVGLLSINHDEQRRLVINQTPEAAWETGEWTDLDDQDIYLKIRSTMQNYRQLKRNTECVAPQVKAYFPLLPARDIALSGLPDEISIEFLDLPGLKSVSDRRNLSVIQSQVGKAFSLVALDYLQVNEEKRQRLLSELQTVVRYYHGHVESMIFILNRIDNRGTDDLPLEERIVQLKKEIKEVLDLAEEPDLIPFNARLLYYSQCAWGTTPLDSASEVPQALRIQFLEALFNDCAKVIRENLSENRELRQWFRDLEDNVADQNEITDEDLRKLLQYAMQWSGGKKLWDCIQTRLKDSFSELVIIPILVETLNSFDALNESLEILLQARRIGTTEEVNQEKEKVVKIRNDLQACLSKIREDFHDTVNVYMAALKNDNPKLRLKIKQETEANGIQGFSAVFDSVRNVETDLITSLIIPIRQSFHQKESMLQVKEKLEPVIGIQLAQEIAQNYERVQKVLGKFSKHKNGRFIKRRVPTNDDEALAELKQDERVVKLFYRSIRKAISRRAEFCLQAQAKQFKEVLESLVENQLKQLEICLTVSKEYCSITLSKAAISSLYKKLLQNPPALPENFFEIQDLSRKESKTEIEIVGSETFFEESSEIRRELYTEYYRQGSCFKSTRRRLKARPVIEKVKKPVVKKKYSEIDYMELFLPSPQTMAKQWSEGINSTKGSLWDVLSKWIMDRLDYVNETFEQSAINITDLAERTLNKQLEIIETNFQENTQKLHEFEIKKENIIATRIELERLAKRKDQ
ncbi:hypothetical protein Lepto7376_0566 [[Leptolyngbya] sp. PCC 7376]|uniref:dynamin family protein n=1 Tax=[Leptolyngbya] sp. PCC 7376 TaxID=111781 RepID=UPI00029F09E8|nr:dynamin family protein [[Leptolyngbya] sp. PCC 7376]AFY36992.1 hypothetical protein Lepto7376_0566 [[Leptolyngbya] sp. PCC 7376]